MIATKEDSSGATRFTVSSAPCPHHGCNAELTGISSPVWYSLAFLSWIAMT